MLPMPQVMSKICPCLFFKNLIDFFFPFLAPTPLEPSGLSFPFCFSTRRNPEIVTFDFEDEFGGIVNEGDAGKRLPGDLGRSINPGPAEATASLARMQCFPLYSVLLALGMYEPELG